MSPQRHKVVNCEDMGHFIKNRSKSPSSSGFTLSFSTNFRCVRFSMFKIPYFKATLVHLLPETVPRLCAIKVTKVFKALP